MSAGKTHSYAPPRSRPLKVFAFDPSLGRQFSNHMTIHVPYETVTPGPVGGTVAVVDWDFSCKTFYEPVDLEAPQVLMNGGLNPAEGDPRFHQQMVYAVVSETVARFESALGREIHWRQAHGEDARQKTLRVFPHAFQQANAFYHPKMCALLFGYFTADAEGDGRHRVFTCLSHDIIAHETTHAVLDSLRRHFAEPTGPDTLAFHEAIADIVALFLHFSVEEAVFDTIRRTGGLLFKSALDPLAAAGGTDVQAQLRRDNPLVGLAQQFGRGLGRRSALRRALGEEPDPKKLATVTEPHLRGAILVAAVFDAFFTAYVTRTRDLMRLAANNTDGGRELHHDLARRLTAEATKTASHFLDICIRAIDYCPPVDIRFGEFLRAMITADRDLVPEDRYDYRGALIEAFRRRGIHPQGVMSFSEDMLAWERPEKDIKCPIGFTLKPNGESGSVVDITIHKGQMDRLARFATDNKDQLGLSGNVKPWSIQPIRRIGPDGRLHVEFAVEFVDSIDEPVDEADPTGPHFTFRGGAAVIFDASGNAKYTIRKSTSNKERVAEQRRFRQGLMDGWANAAFTAATMPDFHFGLVHGGM